MARGDTPSSTASSGNYHTHALTRGLRILDMLANGAPPLTLQDLHTQSELPKSTLVRLLSALCDELMIVRVDERPAYRLGPKTLHLAQSYVANLDLTHLARPYLSRVASETGQTANLGVLDGADVLHVAIEYSGRPLRFDSSVGERAGAHYTGLGKVLLSGLSDREAQQRLPRKLKKITDYTITTYAALLEALAQVRSRGYATDISENSVGLSCVAVPVVSNGALIAALSVSGPSGEFDEDSIRSYLTSLRSAATALAKDGDLVNGLSHVSRAA